MHPSTKAAASKRGRRACDPNKAFAMLFNGRKTNFREQVIHACVGFFVGAAVMSLLSSKAAENKTVQTALMSASPIFTLDDEMFLGPQEGDIPPRRLGDYVYKTNTYQNLYDQTWTKGGYPAQSCWGCRFATEVVNKVEFNTMLDAGTGNGALVRMMRSHGKSAWGIELSRAVLEQECPDMLKAGFVEPGILTNLPYADNSFDLVWSSDVLEHIHPEEAEKVVSELVRVSRRHLVLTISLKGHTKATASNNNEAGRHTMLRPRHWWEDTFKKYGAVVNKDLFWGLQEFDKRYTRNELKDCRMEGEASDGGLYEVCIVDNNWLVGRREQENLRRDRCITTENMEMEPWFFTFRKLR